MKDVKKIFVRAGLTHNMKFWVTNPKKIYFWTKLSQSDGAYRPEILKVIKNDS